MLDNCKGTETKLEETLSKEESSNNNTKPENCSKLLLQIEQAKESFKLLAQNSFYSGDIPPQDVSLSPINVLNKKPMKIKILSPNNKERRSSRTLLHPDHAKLMVQKTSPGSFPTLEQKLFESTSVTSLNGDLITYPQSSSMASSASTLPGLQANCSGYSEVCVNCESRRSSDATNKYSVLDALDLEYALIKAATRGSVGPHSLSRSLQKLTFTQSLAFPALAKGLSSKRSSSPPSNNKSTIGTFGSGMNAFAKVITVLILVVISVLVFGMLYKFIRT